MADFETNALTVVDGGGRIELNTAVADQVFKAASKMGIIAAGTGAAMQQKEKSQDLSQFPGVSNVIDKIVKGTGEIDPIQAGKVGVAEKRAEELANSASK